MKVTGNTLIKTSLQNDPLPISYLFEQQFTGQVYSLQNGGPNLINCLKITKETINSIYQITFVNGSSLICSADSPISLRNGEWRTANILFPGIIMWRFSYLYDADGNIVWKGNWVDEQNDDMTIASITILEGSQDLYSISVAEDDANFATIISTNNGVFTGLYVRS